MEMEIKILGPGYRNCEKLQANANEALKKIGMEATIIKVEDPKEIAKYGIMQTPGLVINEKVVSYGRILTPKHIAELLQK
jgi:small redox-active disulfide protein 2